MIGLVFLLMLFCLYFVPSFMGMQKRNATAIFVLNLFLGWTLIGWVIAMVWACTVDDEVKVS